MKGRLAGQQGMSLVEATIILMVLAILTSVIAPSMGDYIDDARNVKAKEDVEAIGTAILRLVRDTGLGCVSDDPAPISTACTTVNRVDLLVSNGNDTTSTGAQYNAPGGTVQADAASNWIGGTGAVAADRQDTMDNQFVLNTPDSAGANAYAQVNFALGGGPRQGIGWRGVYLTGPIGPDPWGYKYQANTVFLLPASNANTGVTNGLVSGGWINDVIVIAGGPNGDIQTPFGNNTSGATSPTGDDVLYVVTGSSR